MTCEHLKIGATNIVPASTVTFNTPVTTDSEYIKNHYRGRIVKLENPQPNFIFIAGRLDKETIIDHMALTGYSLPDTADLLFQTFSSHDFNTDTLLSISPWLRVKDLKSLEVAANAKDTDIDYGNESDTMNDTLVYLLETPVNALAWRLSIRPNYDVEIEPEPDVEPPVVVTVSDFTFRQDETTQIVSIEAENAVITPNGSDTWQAVSDGSASGGVVLYKNGPAFYFSTTEGPHVKFTFNATVTGTYDFYLLMESTNGNSFYTEFTNGITRTHIYQTGFTNQGSVWLKVRTESITAGQKYTFRLGARDHFLSVDKMEMRPSSAGAPTGHGSAESIFGTVTQTETSDGVVITEPVITNVILLQNIRVGSILQLSTNFSYGSTASFLSDPNLVISSNEFTLVTAQQRKIKELDLQLEMATSKDAYDLREFEINNGGDPFLVIPYPGNDSGWFKSDKSMIAILSGKLVYTEFRENIYQIQLPLKEA